MRSPDDHVNGDDAAVGGRPKAAFNGETAAAGRGGERLADGAGQTITAAGAEHHPAAGNYAASNVEPRAALGKSRA